MPFPQLSPNYLSDEGSNTTRAKLTMTRPQTFIPILAALKAVAPHQASAPVPSPFAARGADTDSHLSINFLVSLFEAYHVTEPPLMPFLLAPC